MQVIVIEFIIVEHHLIFMNDIENCCLYQGIGNQVTEMYIIWILWIG